MATKKKDDLQSKINGLGKGIASGVGDYLNNAISGITGGMSNGKSIGETLDEIKSSGNSYRYTPPTLPSYSGTQQSKQQVTMPTSIGDLPTYDSTYMDQLNALARQLTSMNYDDWTKGSQYQALADRYGQNGRLSMQDVLGQVASRTGGLASSYATTAAQQQYNQYMAQLEEVARQMYSQDRNDLIDSANLYRDLANDEYDRYRDRVSDYNAQLAAAQSAARSAYSGSSTSSKSTGSTSSSGGLDNYNAVKNNILMYADRGMDAVSNRLINQAWGKMSASQQKDLMNTLKKKGWAE
nr:MAG TPA: hypothetical protein [Caudoviricetes sp.]